MKEMSCSEKPTKLFLKEGGRLTVSILFYFQFKEKRNGKDVRVSPLI